MSKRSSFYQKTIDSWLPDRNASILVVAGGPMDKQVFEDLGFTDVIISNLSTIGEETAYAPYSWRHEDAENLSVGDGAYDYVVVHAGLHHCLSPHRALLEMYRVARRGVIVFESRDSLVMRLLARLGMTQMYEHFAVYKGAGKCGGVRNSEIPNYVYRWTEREFEKTISSYAPYVKHKIHYRYGYDAPATVSARKKASIKLMIIGLLRPLYGLFSMLFPRQQNLFACFIEKPNLQQEHFEWLTWQDGKLGFNTEWARNHYKNMPVMPDEPRQADVDSTKDNP